MNPDQAKLELYKVRDIGQMMGFAANLVRRHWKHMFKTIGLMSLPLMLMASTLYYLGTSNRADVFAPASGINLYLAYAAIYITYCTLFWGTVYYVQLYDEKGPENFQWNDIWAKVFKHGWWLLLANLIILFLFGLLATVSSKLIFTVIFIPIALLLIFGLFAFTQLWTVIFLFEARSLVHSLDRAFKLMKDQWLRAIALLVCSLMVISGIVMMPVYISYFRIFIDGIGYMENFLQEELWLILLFQNLFIVLLFLSTFFNSLSFTAFYLSNVERMEKKHLKQRVARLSDDSTLTSYK